MGAGQPSRGGECSNTACHHPLPAVLQNACMHRPAAATAAAAAVSPARPQGAAYGGTYDLVNKELSQLGITASMVDINTHPDTWEHLLTPHTKVSNNVLLTKAGANPTWAAAAVCGCSCVNTTHPSLAFPVYLHEPKSSASEFLWAVYVLVILQKNPQTLATPYRHTPKPQTLNPYPCVLPCLRWSMWKRSPTP